jgi:excinuclease ABC subunit C
MVPDGPLEHHRLRSRRPAVAEALRERLKHVPREPGVYLFRDARGQLLYIGKAKELRRRVFSYFTAARHPNRIARMVRQIADVQVVTTLSEDEALTHEAHLIREHQPPYNIALKYERPYTYLKLTTYEDFPRLEVAHEVSDDGAAYFGPYASSSAMLLLKDTVDRHFRLRKRPEPIGEWPRKPCWHHQLGRCLAPCAHRVDPERYGSLVEDALRFLRGERAPLLEGLRQRMWEASSRTEYEWAAEIRDQITALERVFERQQAIRPDPVDQDVVAASIDGVLASLVLLVFRKSRLMGLRRVDLDELEPEDLAEAVESLLKQHYASGAELPSEVLVDRPLADRRALSRWLSGLAGHRVRVGSPRTARDERLMAMARKNVELSLKTRLSEAGPGHVLERLRVRLALGPRPDRIECIDTSHLHGEDHVASLVVCSGAKMDRSEYRRYRVEGLTPGDDFAAIGQVVARRLDRLLREERELPDLLLIDGGPPQLAAALAEVRARGLQHRVELAAIAKGRKGARDALQRTDRIWRPDEEAALDLRDEPSALLLLQRIRDEAHRFAVEMQRSVRARRSLASALDTVPGVGRVRKRELLRALGTVKRVAGASAEDLARVPGIDRRTAARIHAYFRQSAGRGE